MGATFNPDDEENDVIVADDTNSVVQGKHPAREVVRQAIRNRLEKEKRSLELLAKSIGRSAPTSNGKEDIREE